MGKTKEGSDEKQGFVVVVEFIDGDDGDKVYTKGSDVSNLDKSRLSHLVNMGLVEASK